VDDTGQVTKDGQEDVDEEVTSAATLEKDSDGREDDGKNDLADIAGGERHDVCLFCKSSREARSKGCVKVVGKVGW
jgi:hypothetical protein